MSEPLRELALRETALDGCGFGGGCYRGDSSQWIIWILVIIVIFCCFCRPYGFGGFGYGGYGYGGCGCGGYGRYY
jgi:hypothetical protein